MSGVFGAINDEKLDPEFRTKAQAFLEAARAHGLDVRVSSGWRSSALQAILYKKFLAGIGGRAAKPGSSKHEKGQAIDCLIWRQGKPVENGDDPAYEELHSIAERYGLKGLPAALHDAGHIELAT
jgi:LAS superfamily LD-carboxypeptidase LdcB